MRSLGKFAFLSALFATSAGVAFGDQLDLSGPGTFSGGVYSPGFNSGTNIFAVNLATGVFDGPGPNSFDTAVPVFYGFNDATVPTGNLFSIESDGGTIDLTYKATSENIINSNQVVFNGELYENGTPFSAAMMGFSENPVGFSNTEDSVTVAATPEPSSIALLGTGLLGLAGAFRRRLMA